MDTLTDAPNWATAQPTPSPPGPDHAASADGPPTGDRRGLAGRVLRGPRVDPSWARPALLALLLATGILYFTNLTSSGWANSFYSATAQAGSESWKAFFFGSSDAASSITVDKTPASLWVMALSVRAFGLSSFSILMPQVLMGIATVGVVYATVKRQFGAAAGLLGGLVMALTPVAVLMFRFNNPDALLTLLMAVGAYSTARAVEKASPRWLVLVGVLLGMGFLTKMLQVLLVLPAFAVAYVIAAPTTLAKRILHSLAAGAALVATAGWWIAVVELVPASARPYIGGSQTNSILELTLGYNGLGRLSGDETGSVGGGGGWGATGLGRLFSSSIGGQISWLIPSALILLAAGLWFRGRAGRTDARRAAYVVWGGWLLVTGLTFSLMAGIFHEYYTVALAPAVGALVGMGAGEAWERRGQLVGRAVLAGATAVGAIWSFVLLTRVTDWGSSLRVLVLVIGLAAAALLVLVTRLHPRGVPFVVAGAVIALLAGPAAYAVDTVSTGHSGSIVTAGPSTGGRAGLGPGGASPGAAGRGTQPGAGGGTSGLLDAALPGTEVVAALSADADQYTWVAAAVGSQNAAGLQLGSELPVMAIGGFNGSDPSPTLAQFQALAEAGQIHYFLASTGLGGGADDGSSSAGAISSWVQKNFTAVTIGGSTFYDLTQPVAGFGSADTSTT